jgi:hypothetical protein
MDGTAAQPGDYTGRAGVPGFAKVGVLEIFRVPANTDAIDTCATVLAGEGQGRYELLCRDGRRAYAAGGDPAERSEMTPEWIAAPDGAACARLEDTRRAKRLLVDEPGGDISELRSAHLACFAWRTQAGAAAVVDAARRRAAMGGFPALFVAVDKGDARCWRGRRGRCR